MEHSFSHGLTIETTLRGRQVPFAGGTVAPRRARWHRLDDTARQGPCHDPSPLTVRFAHGVRRAERDEKEQRSRGRYDSITRVETAPKPGSTPGCVRGEWALEPHRQGRTPSVSPGQQIEPGWNSTRFWVKSPAAGCC